MNIEKLNEVRTDLIYNIDVMFDRIVNHFGRFSIEESLVLRTKAALLRD